MGLEHRLFDRRPARGRVGADLRHGVGFTGVPPLRTEREDLHLALSQDGQRVATGGFRIARVWDTATGEPVSPALKHSGDLNVRTGPDLLGGCLELLTLSNREGAGTATMWNAQTGEQLHTLKHDTESRPARSAAMAHWL